MSNRPVTIQVTTSSHPVTTQVAMSYRPVTVRVGTVHTRAYKCHQVVPTKSNISAGQPTSVPTSAYNTPVPPYRAHINGAHMQSAVTVGTAGTDGTGSTGNTSKADKADLAGSR